MIASLIPSMLPSIIPFHSCILHPSFHDSFSFLPSFHHSFIPSLFLVCIIPSFQYFFHATIGTTIAAIRTESGATVLVDKDSQKHNRVVTVSGPKDAVETALALLTARLETTRRKDIPVTWHNTPPAVEAPQRSSVLAGGAEAIDRDGGTDTDTDEDSTDYELDDDDDALHICDVALSAAAAIDAHGWVVSAHDWMIVPDCIPWQGPCFR